MIWDGSRGGNYVVAAYSGMTFTDFVIYADIIDLTEIYGSGNEPTTLLQYAQDMGYSSIDDVPYYEKTDGTIVLNCKHESVISKSRNLWDEEWEVGTYSNSTGEKVSATDRIRSKNYIPVRGGEKVTCYYGQDSTSTHIYMWFFAADKAFIREGSGVRISGRVITLPVNCAYATIGSYGGTLSEYANDICVKYDSSVATEYSPYIVDTLPLPTLTAFPNGLRGVGTAYDEVSLAEGKATKRMAELVLKGTESWYVGHATNKAFKCAFSVKSAVTDGSIKANAICASLAVSTTNNVYNGTIGFGLNKFEIWLKDGVSESVDALKANLAANPVHIFYEVAEPTESTFTPCRAYYKASNNGQETATAEEATAPFTAEIGYIDYVPINPVSVQSEEESPILADE